jgi:hypothetical protein
VHPIPRQSLEEAAALDLHGAALTSDAIREQGTSELPKEAARQVAEDRGEA